MSVNSLRILLVAAATVLLMTGISAWFATPIIGSAYTMIVGDLGTEGPNLTVNFAVPMLHAGAHTEIDGFTAPLWVNLIWLLAVVWPVPVVTWSCRATTVEGIVARWVVVSTLALGLILGLTMMVFVGLVLPVAPL